MVSRFAWIGDAIAEAARWVEWLMPRPVRRAYDRTGRALYRAGRSVGLIRARRVQCDTTLLTAFTSPNFRPMPAPANRDDGRNRAHDEAAYRSFVPRPVRAQASSQVARRVAPESGDRRPPAMPAYPYALGNIRRGSLSTAEIIQEIDIAAIELLVRHHVRHRPQTVLRVLNVRSIYRTRGRDVTFATIRQVREQETTAADPA